MRYYLRKDWFYYPFALNNKIYFGKLLRKNEFFFKFSSCVIVTNDCKVIDKAL